MERRSFSLTMACVLVSVLTVPNAWGKSTLEIVRERGYLQCGVAEVGIGVSYLTEEGRWAGFFPDYCRAIAAATVGSSSAVEFILTDVGNRFDALRSGAIDVLVSNTTWTLGRDATLGVHFTSVLYYDGQGFLAHKALGVRSVGDLGTATICVTAAGTTTEKNLAEYIRLNNPKLTAMPFQSTEGRSRAFLRRQCDVLTTDRLVLVSFLSSYVPNRDDYVLFPEVISREPLGPVVRDDDAQWFDIVQWVTFATVAAEGKGVTAANVSSMKTSSDPEVRRLLGVEGSLGKDLGIDNAWAYRIIEQVGNYGEIYERNLGKDTPIGLDRGSNALWMDGGLMYAPPLR